MTRLHRPWLRIVQGTWLSLILLSLAFFILGLPRLYDQLGALRGDFTFSVHIDSPAIRPGLAVLGISVRFYAAYILVIAVLFAAFCLATAFLIVHTKLDDWLVLLLSLTYVAYGTGFIYIIAPPPLGFWPPPLDVITRFLNFFCGMFLYLVFFYLFPDGRFVPRWTAVFAAMVVGLGIYLTLYFYDSVFVNPASSFTPLGIVLILAVFASVIAAQVYRYRYVSSPSQRQQTKWVVFGFMTAIIMNIVINLPIIAFPALIPAGTAAALFVLASVTFSAVFSAVGLLSFTIAILRYRLWDIDRLIRRTLVYSLLSAALGLTYFGSVAVLQGLVQTLTGRPESSSGVTVLSTLALAVVFKPLRDRIQVFIDNRFYQRRYNADKIIADFARLARDEIDVSRLEAALLGAVQGSMHPEHVSLWFAADASVHRPGEPGSRP